MCGYQFIEKYREVSSERFSSVQSLSRVRLSSSLSAIRVVSSAYLRLLIFLLAILIPACTSSSPAFLMMYSAYKLNKQGDLKDDAVKVLHSICQQIWKTQQWPQEWKRSVFILIPKKITAKECSNYHTVALISHSSKVMLKILQARLQHYVNRELPDVQAVFRKGRGTRDQIANIWWIIEKAREFQKNIYFCFIDYAKAFDCVDHNKLWKILKEMRIADHLTCLLSNLYAGLEATVRTGHGTTDWFQMGKRVCQDCILSERLHS